MGFFVRLGSGIKRSVTGTFQFFQGGVAELKKVRWPSRQELVNFTIVVIVTVTLLTFFFFLVDLGIAEMVKWIIKA